MRLRSIHVRNLGPFRDLSADLTTLPEEAKLVAITGPNGAGKSTALELWTGGALFRECRTRGSLASLATSRDAMLEVRVDNGQPWTVRHTVDGQTGKGESVAIDSDGRPAFSDAKVRSFDAWASAHMPSPELLYGSQVLPQGSGGFLDLKPGDRKAVALRLLGVERLEPMSKAARDKAREVSAKADTVGARLEDARGRSDTEGAEIELADARTWAASQAESVTRAQLELDVARQLAGDSALARQRYEEQLRSYNDLLARSKQSANALDHALYELGKADVSQAEFALGVANGTCDAAKVSLTKAESEAQALRLRRDAAQRQAEDRHRVQLELDRAKATKRDIEVRLERIRLMLAKGPEIEAFVAAREAAKLELPRLLELEEVASKALDGCAADLEALSNERHAGAESRIGSLREGLSRVISSTSPAVVAEETLAADDAAVEAVESFPARMRAAEAARAAARLALTSTSKAVEVCRAKATAVSKDEEALATAKALLSEREEQLAKAVAEVERLSDELEALPEPERVPADPDLATLRKLADRAAAAALDAEKSLAAARATREQLEPQVERLREEVRVLQARLEATPVPVPPESAPDLAALEKALAAAKDEASRAAASVGSAQARLEAAQAAKAQAEVLAGELAVLRQEQADWTRLGDDLGRDGLQAALIDSACAQLTETTNDLLHSCVGSRWTVSLETQRDSADGKRKLEGFDVRVIDSENGRDTTAETLSGGERVLVGEALSLALTTMACHRAGIERPTLVRDETGAALDPVKARAYVAMLRRAADAIGADRVLFVSHSREVQELADARIEIGGQAA